MQMLMFTLQKVTNFQPQPWKEEILIGPIFDMVATTEQLEKNPQGILNQVHQLNWKRSWKTLGCKWEFSITDNRRSGIFF